MPEPVAYLVDWPNKIESSLFFIEQNDPARSRPLITTEQAQAYAQAVRDEALARQATVANKAIDNASALASTLHAEAKRLNAESKPDVLASERQANAILTDEIERLQGELKRARPKYFSDGHQAGWNSALEEAAKRAESMHHDSAPYWVAARIRALKREES